VSDAFNWVVLRIIGAVQLLVLLGFAWLLFALGWAAMNFADPRLETLRGVAADMKKAPPG
jgi:hypothetical protein